MAILLFGALFALNCIDKFSAKKLQIGMEFDMPRIVAANTVNTVLAVVFYLITLKFELYFEPKMELLSGIYGILCFAGLVLAIILYKHVSIPLAAIIVTSASITGSSVFGYVVLKEHVTAARVVAAALVILAVVLPGVEGLKGKNKMKKSDLLFCVFYFVFCVITNIFGTVYVAFPDMDGGQYCMHVNIYILVVCAVVAGYLILSGKSKLRAMAHSLTLSQTGILGIRSCMSQSMNLCIIALVAIIPITMYNIINCSLSMIAAVAVSLIYYREKMTFTQAVSLVFLVAATGLSSM